MRLLRAGEFLGVFLSNKLLMPHPNEVLLQMAVNALSPSLKFGYIEVSALPGQHGLYFPDAENEVALVFFVLAERCGSGSDERKFERLISFILDEARKALPGGDVTAMFTSLSL
jgi:hypothetical protein